MLPICSGRKTGELPRMVGHLIVQAQCCLTQRVTAGKNSTAFALFACDWWAHLPPYPRLKIDYSISASIPDEQAISALRPFPPRSAPPRSLPTPPALHAGGYSYVALRHPRRGYPYSSPATPTPPGLRPPPPPPPGGEGSACDIQWKAVPGSPPGSPHVMDRGGYHHGGGGSHGDSRWTAVSRERLSR